MALHQVKLFLDRQLTIPWICAVCNEQRYGVTNKFKDIQVLLPCKCARQEKGKGDGKSSEGL